MNCPSLCVSCADKIEANCKAARLCQGLFNGGDDFWVVGRSVGGKAGDYFAVAADEELFEVPEKLREWVGWGESVLRSVAGEVLAPWTMGDVLWSGGDEGGV